MNYARTTDVLYHNKSGLPICQSALIICKN